MNISRKHFAAILGGALIAGGLAGGVAQAEYQGHMLQARRALLAARHQLQLGDHDKGGHRIAAIRAVNEALRQVDIAVRYDNHH
ncbi:MAG: hypothetical protein B7Z59_01855 [Acidiphilium sp. 37-67-22]|jgi:hypothetical protein|nr:MAG: hypothetical protein B7Z76_11610 [Acidiphilium sp. 20-67-58]OYW12273.1 MAG: hypothetical protein B7Z59_01855 [Acidiphilium sp. 37-67-22]HQU10911.1 hypothetical protein [Acidiphilium sp.]